jgi:hypothetical protein
MINDRMTNLADNMLARRDGASVIVRPSPLRVSWVMNDLVSSDLHKLAARFACSLEVVNNNTDRKMLAEVLLADRDAVTVEDLRNHFAAAMRSAAMEIAKQHPADEWLAEKHANEMVQALSKSAERIAFACGMRALAPYQLELSSPTLEQHRLEEIQRQRARERVAGQVEHLKHATELLKHFQEIRRDAPDLNAGQVLSQIAPADRGTMLETLLMASAQSSDSCGLVLVAGQSLLRIEMDEDQPRTRTIELPMDLGPLRSVRGATIDDEPSLLIGARAGVIVASAPSPDEATSYGDPSVQSQLGFNSAIVLRNRILATHSEAGLVAWNLGEAGPPPMRLSPHGARNLIALDTDAAALSSGNRLGILRADEVDYRDVQSEAEIVALVRADALRLLVVHGDGLVAIYDLSQDRFIDREPRGGKIVAAGALPWLSSSRLLLATESGAVDCVGVDDQLVTRYLSNRGAMRMVAGSPRLVAGITPDRQRLVLWNSWDGRKPVAEVHVTGLTHHRVADAQFV